jgi:PPP family 3-phenylpropionic acid transporter
MLFFNLSAFFFFYFPIIGIYVIFLPKILANLGYSSMQIGILFAIAPLLRFIIPFFFVKFFSINKAAFTYALIGAFAAALLFYVTIENFYAFALANVLMGLSLGIILPYIETASIGHLGREQYGKSRLYGSLSFALIGLVVAKILSVDEDYTIVLHFFLTTIILTILFGYILSSIEEEPGSSAQTLPVNFAFWPHIGFWVNIFLMQVAFGAFYNFFTIYETAHGISLETTSYLWAFGVFCEIIMLYYQSHILKHFTLLDILKFATLITAFRWLLLYLFPESVAISYFSQSLHAFSFALYHSSALMFLYDNYTNKRLAGQFFYGFSFGLGSMVGSLVAGYFYGEYLFLVSSLITFVAFAVLAIEAKRRRVV